MDIEQRIIQKIADASPILEQLPGIIIIHRLYPVHTVVYMSPRGLRELKMTLGQLQKMGAEYHRQFFNPEDAADYVPKIQRLLERNNNEESVSFFQQVRTTDSDEWHWHLSGIRIFMQDDHGDPLLTITSSVPVDAKHYFTIKIERLLEENTFLKENNQLFAAMTKREREILIQMALGKNSTEIANDLHLSDDTVKTHRRNIKRKLKARNHYDIVRFAQAFNMI